MFFFPISDINPTQKKPFISWLILFLCVLIFIFQKNMNFHEEEAFIMSYGMIPSVVFNIVELPENLKKIHPFLTLISSMFLHGGWMHLIGNMAYLYIFGDNIEDSMGKIRFIVFYLMCGIFAAFSQALIDFNSITPMIGASGAISGILGGYLVLFPKAKIRVFFWFLIFVRTFNIPAMYVIGGWIFIQFFNLSDSSSSNVAYAAHIGGFVSGMILILFFKKIISQTKKKLTKGTLPDGNY